MASFVFETGDQTAASNFQSGDTLVFQTDLPTSLNLALGTTTQFNQTTISIGDANHTLTFAQSALAGGTLQFLNDGDGTLKIGTTGTDTLTLSSKTGASAAYGFDGDDTITLTSTTNDVASGGAGKDTIDASKATGNLFLYGGADADTITGGNGNNHIYGNAIGAPQGSSDGNDTIVGGTGSDYIQGNAGNDTISDAGGSNHIFGGSGDDKITLTGTGVSSVNGNTGNDVITASGLNAGSSAIIHGGQDNDSITGSGGNDILFGDKGNDTITGGAGVDIVYGGDGANQFNFGVGDAAFATGANANNYDTIVDFSSTDTMKITNFATATVLYNDGSATPNNYDGAHTIADALLTNSASTASVAAITVGSDTYLFYNSAGTAHAASNSVIELQGVSSASSITSADFVS